jgi:hypothetical protein
MAYFSDELEKVPHDFHSLIWFPARAAIFVLHGLQRFRQPCLD